MSTNTNTIGNLDLDQLTEEELSILQKEERTEQEQQVLKDAHYRIENQKKKSDQSGVTPPPSNDPETLVSATVVPKPVVSETVVSEEDSSNCVDLSSKHRADILTHLNAIEDIIKVAKGIEGLNSNSPISPVRKQDNKTYFGKKSLMQKLIRQEPSYAKRAKRLNKIERERQNPQRNEQTSIKRVCQRKYGMFSPKRKRCIKNNGPERQAAMQGGKKMTKKRLNKNTRKNRRNRRN